MTTNEECVTCGRWFKFEKPAVKMKKGGYECKVCLWWAVVRAFEQAEIEKHG